MENYKSNNNNRELKLQHNEMNVRPLMIAVRYCTLP